jgi:hypothetical protein
MKQGRQRRGNWGSSACVGVLRLQREGQELECKLKLGQTEEGEGRREDPERRRLPLMAAAITARCLRKGNGSN